MNTKSTLLALLVAATLAATAGCDDSAARQRESLLAQQQAALLQQQALLAQQQAQQLALQRAQLAAAQAEQDQASERVAQHRARVQQTQFSLAEARSQHSALQEGVQSFIGRNRMAVAAIAAGAVGGGLALGNDSSVSQEVRNIGAAVGMAALVYAAFNLEEVTHVLRELTRANEHLQALERRQAELDQQLQGEQAAWQQAQERLDSTAARVTQMRAALSNV